MVFGPKARRRSIKLATIGIALVWLINGLFCKLLNFVPRHKMIVSRLFGEAHAHSIIKTIGVLEVFMVVWILSGIRSRWCAFTQIVVVALMNIVEFMLVPDLLLFGRINAIFAVFFIALVYATAVMAKETNDTYTSLDRKAT